MNVELASMMWGALGGAAMFALGLYWFWDMKPSNAETAWLRSEVKDLRGDVKDLRGDVEDLNDEYNGLNKRVHAIEHPPFEPKFGDRIMAECVERSGSMWPAVYLFTREKMHRVVACKDGGEVVEYFTDKIGPLDD